MLKKTITYTDYDGNRRSEDFYFNLTKSEITEMELGINGGLDAMLDRVIQKRDGSVIIKVFKEILLKAYGEKSLDGRKFEKSEKISDDFYHTGAYDTLFMELVTDAKKAAAFVKAIMPADMQKDIDENAPAVNERLKALTPAEGPAE